MSHKQRRKEHLGNLIFFVAIMQLKRIKKQAYNDSHGVITRMPLIKT